jgi:hypothetical protein
MMRSVAYDDIADSAPFMRGSDRAPRMTSSAPPPSGAMARAPQQSIDLEVEWFDRGELEKLSWGSIQAALASPPVPREREDSPRMLAPPDGSGFTPEGWRRACEWGSED